MELRPNRWRFSHPNIPICPKRLQAALAAGDAADQALSAPHMARAYEAANPGAKVANGSRDEIVRRRTALLSRQDRIRASTRHGNAEVELAAIKADLAAVTEELRAYDRAEHDARQGLIAVTERRNRAARYALECGIHSPEVLAHAENFAGAV